MAASKAGKNAFKAAQCPFQNPNALTYFQKGPRLCPEARRNHPLESVDFRILDGDRSAASPDDAKYARRYKNR